MIHRLLFILAAAIASAAVCLAQEDLSPNNPDLAFKPAFSLGLQLKAVAAQTDGSILAAGSIFPLDSRRLVSLVRLRTDGSVDSTFQADVQPQGFDFSAVHQILPNSDGTIYIAGEFNAVQGVTRPGLARLLPTGSLDPTFDPPGIVSNAMTVIQDRHGALVIPLFTASGPHRLIRLLANGTPDPSFDVSLSFQPESIVSDLRNRLLLAGDRTNWLTRLLPDGTADTSFRPQLPTEASDAVRISSRIVVQADGKILLSAYLSFLGNSDRLLFRVTEDGSLDTFFVPDPVATSALAVQQDGSILVGSGLGFRDPGPSQIARLLPDGSLDPSFQPVKVEMEGELPFDGGLGAWAILSDALLVGGSGQFRLNGAPYSGLARLRLHRFPHSAVAVWAENRFSSPGIAGAGSVQEGTNEARFFIHRYGNLASAATVRYSTSDITAKADKNYRSQLGIVEFAPFEFEQVVSVPLIDNSTFEGARTFALTLAPSPDFESVGGPEYMTIHDDELGFFADAARIGSTSQGRSLTLQFTTRPSSRYTIEGSDDFKTWRVLDGNVFSSPSQYWLERDIPPSPSGFQRFYRIHKIESVATPP